MKLLHVFREHSVFFCCQRRAIVGTFDILGHHRGEHHAGGIAAFPAIGSRKQLQNFNYLRLGEPIISRLYTLTVFPGRINLPLQPLQNLVGFDLIF